VTARTFAPWENIATLIFSSLTVAFRFAQAQPTQSRELHWSNAPDHMHVVRLKFRSLEMSDKRFPPLNHGAVASGLFYF